MQCANVLIDALMFVKGGRAAFLVLFLGSEKDVDRAVLLGCGQDREGPLRVEGKLL